VGKAEIPVMAAGSHRSKSHLAFNQVLINPNAEALQAPIQSRKAEVSVSSEWAM